MSEKIVQCVPEPISKNPSHRKMAWFLAVSFVLINTFLILISVLTPFGAERVLSISELIFWFDLACVGILGAYFGVDLAVFLIPRREQL